MTDDGRHIVVTTCVTDDQKTLLREVANGCTQLLLDLREQLDDGQTVTVESVDVVRAHGGPMEQVHSMLRITGEQKAVVITALVKTKPKPEPEHADAQEPTHD